MLLMDMALVTKCIVTAKEEQGNAVFAYSKRCLTSCTLLTRWSALVLKVGAPRGL